VAEGGHIDFVGDVLVIDVQKFVVDPCMGNFTLLGIFDTDALGLFAEKVEQCN